MNKENSSFRDPCGFIFFHNNTLYRQINKKGGDDYDLLMASGLYTRLSERNWLIKHEEFGEPSTCEANVYKVIKPEIIPFISYPYEWSFSQLKDAALLTLNIQLLSIKHGMILKDASAYNIQFIGAEPILIDTLSFSRYHEGKPWEAYRQFCQHFLAPLLLMSKMDIRLNGLSKVNIDGIPLDLTSSLLPNRTWLSPSVLAHIHFHAKAQKTYASIGNTISQKKKSFRALSRNGLTGIISNLKRLIESLDWKPTGTEWADYYQNTNYTDTAFSTKSRIIESYLDQIKPQKVWDLGANTGIFSRLASSRGISTVAFDIDPAAVDLNYRQAKANKELDILPLIMDLTNPSPSIGWANKERLSFTERKFADCVFAFALIHHLSISNNVPLEKLSDFFATIGRNLIVEFVPKSDSQVRRLLNSRADIFDEYSEQHFEESFDKNFTIKNKSPIIGSDRILYWMASRSE